MGTRKERKNAEAYSARHGGSPRKQEEIIAFRELFVLMIIQLAGLDHLLPPGRGCTREELIDATMKALDQFEISSYEPEMVRRIIKSENLCLSDKCERILIKYLKHKKFIFSKPSNAANPSEAVNNFLSLRVLTKGWAYYQPGLGERGAISSGYAAELIDEADMDRWKLSQNVLSFFSLESKDKPDSKIKPPVKSKIPTAPQGVAVSKLLEDASKIRSERAARQLAETQSPMAAETSLTPEPLIRPQVVVSKNLRGPQQPELDEHIASRTSIPIQRVMNIKEWGLNKLGRGKSFDEILIELAISNEWRSTPDEFVRHCTKVDNDKFFDLLKDKKLN